MDDEGTEDRLEPRTGAWAHRGRRGWVQVGEAPPDPAARLYADPVVLSTHQEAQP